MYTWIPVNNLLGFTLGMQLHEKKHTNQLKFLIHTLFAFWTVRMVVVIWIVAFVNIIPWWMEAAILNVSAALVLQVKVKRCHQQK